MQFRFLSCSIFSAIHGESRRSVGVVKREILRSISGHDGNTGSEHVCNAV